MAIKIGHSSIDENGKAHGGKAGDQTGKEICTRTWYAGGWEFVIRAKSSTVAEKMAKACEAGCANDNIGYDQYQRTTLYTQAKKVNYDLSKITTPCECDCSTFMCVCALAGGTVVDPNLRTATMKQGFNGSSFDILTDSKYLTSDKYLKRGDILVKAGHHTVMALANGSGVTAATTTTTASSSSVKYYARYTGTTNSIVNALMAIGVKDTTKAHRKQIAAANGITGYTGTSAQNLKLVGLLKQGKLIHE